MAKVEEMKIDQLVPDDHNFNEGTEFGQHLMEKSLSEYGIGRGILLDKNNRIISGNKTTETAAALGFEKVIVVETEGDELVAVRRKDLNLDAERGRGMALADNVTAKENIKFNLPEIEDVTKDMDLNPADWGIDLGDIDLGIKEAEEDDFDENEDEIPARCKACELWQLGRHRLMCGDSTDLEQVKKLLGGGRSGLVLD